MKHFTIIFLTVFLVAGASSQSKKVLFEEFTNASCAPCASNNPALKSYIESKGDTIVAVKYHTEFPGFDPMYNANPGQVNERRTGYYTDVNAVPWLKGDGDMFPDIWPFTLANFDNAFNTRKNVNPLLTMSVTDLRIAGDSVRSVIRLNIPQNLPSGNYKLRVMAVEGVIEYAVPPGSNGERIFEHVFRRGFPDMNGTPISEASGNYEYVFTYSLEDHWVDTSIYTIAFVQNDASGKEVLNCASAGSPVTALEPSGTFVPENFSLEQNYPNPFNPATVIRFGIPAEQYITLSVYNSLGERMNLLIDSKLSAGSYEVSFDGSSLSSGVYFYTLHSENIRLTRKMLLIR